MNGPDHYRAAEGWLAEVRYDTVTPQSAQALAAAQIHATLALAAAVATLDAAEGPGGGSATGRTSDDAVAWEGALTQAEVAR
jgi:hypothetical protein